MTNKEIIIDGVNVAGCKHYANYGGCLAEKDDDGDTVFNCKEREMHDCNYKQLQRKEQECEELKAELQISKDDHAYAVELEKDIEHYKQALEKIEEIAMGAYKQRYIDPVGVGKAIISIINEVLND